MQGRIAGKPKRAIESIRFHRAFSLGSVQGNSWNADTREVECSRESGNYEISVLEKLVSVKFGSRVTIQDIDNYAKALRADPRFAPNFSEIIDLSEVEEFQSEAKEAMALADQIDPFCLSARRAFVAQTPAQIHTARMHQLLRDAKKSIGIFHSLAEAREWIRSGTAPAPESSNGTAPGKARAASAGES